VSRAIKGIVAVAVAAGGLWAATAWPRLNEVETGRSPEYPDLRLREYAASPDRVAAALREALSRRPRWTVTGTAAGPQGVVVQAVHETPLLRLKDDVTVRIRPSGGRALVSVRSRSRVGKWDFGQNARNVRELLTALDDALR
jgi:uncharacterized protein (DUF1499 family)